MKTKMRGLFENPMPEGVKSTKGQGFGLKKRESQRFSSGADELYACGISNLSLQRQDNFMAVLQTQSRLDSVNFHAVFAEITMAFRCFRVSEERWLRGCGMFNFTLQ